MRGCLATLALLGALSAPPSSAAASWTHDPGGDPAAADSTDGAPDAPLAGGLFPVPAWAIVVTTSAVFAVAAVAFGRRLRSRR